VVLWAPLVERLRSFYPKGERGRPPIGPAADAEMPELVLLQFWDAYRDRVAACLRDKQPEHPPFSMMLPENAEPSKIMAAPPLPRLPRPAEGGAA